MKKVVILIIFLFFPAISHSQPSIEFNTDSYSAGEVIQGDIIEYNFEFTNNGDEDLIIERVTSS